MYRALLHKRGPLLLSNPRWKLPYYTTPVIFPRWRLCYYTTPVIFPRWRLPYYTTPANLPQMRITLLHQIYLGQTDPPQTGPTQLMETRLQGPTTQKRLSPAYQPQMVITLLHHPCYFPQMEITLLHHPC